MSVSSTTQTLWRWLDCGDFPPPEVRHGARFAPIGPCWLCGGDTCGNGWPRKTAIAPTFTDYANAAHPPSDTVCQACVALSRVEGWQKYVDAYPERGLWRSFPAKEGKRERGFNWLYSSHLFTPSHHETLTRDRARAVLLDPPDPPFCLVLAISGKQQLVFKAAIANSRDWYPVQLEQDRVYVDRAEFAELLALFERLYALGLSKDAILSGRYPQAALKKCGLQNWLDAESAIRPWRSREPDLLRLCHFCAQRPESDHAVPDPQPMPAAPPPQGQLSLF